MFSPRFFWLITIFLSLSVSCSNDDGPESPSGPGVFSTPSGTASIEGELFLPTGSGPFPAIVIVPGSGSDPRQVQLPLVDIVVPMGYALYLYDKRGVGGSTGSYPVETPETVGDFLQARAEDVIGILDFLATHEDIDAARMGVYGSSQGAWVNSLVFQGSDDLAYIIMASGGVASTGLEGYYCSLTDDPNTTIEEAIAALDDYEGPMGFDPVPIISTMQLPVLWIYGNDDRSHPVRYDIELLNGALSRDNFTLQVYEDTDHELLNVVTRMPPQDFYSNIGDWLEVNN